MGVLNQSSAGSVNTTTVKDPTETDVNYGDLGEVQSKNPQANTTLVKGPGKTVSQAVDSSATVRGASSTDAVADERSMGQNSDASYQANKIMSEDSPLMRMSKQQGMLAAASRGLGNSSIAAGNAQAEMSKAAVPLAQQNAAQEQKQELTNQNASNTAELQNVTESNKTDQMNVTQANQANALDATEQNKMQMQVDDTLAKNAMQNADAANKAAMQKAGMDGETARTWLSGEISKNLQGIQGQYQTIIATSQLAGQMYQSTMDSLASMWANSEIPVAQKTAMGQVAINQLQNGLATTASITGMSVRNTFNY